ncbi:PPC domain-containing DNA-binding protein [Actinocorallia sp. A-T 12471]|uniref:PPC domain-containing DNA-binding protein n=1 Tax=Actinocorallia sp. A-T 12471 TaxID=3089813 RepID=UPI0029D28B12|nr:PPC domain-containing DNA-binding protein [Actinocorallia sp. A-T 12471]MDX6741314.1 PPC domain-containing DNA-binding protein [Actinocorallia sp. A-T 12471]
MRSSELRRGRTFGVVFDPGEDFFTALADFCKSNEVRQGYIPMFLGAFSSVDVIGTCERVADPMAPVWTKVSATNVEAIGCGSLAWDPAEDRAVPHVHISVGLKERSAQAHTSHLLGATVQFVAELLVVEVVGPEIRRPPNPAMYDVPLLEFHD